MITFTPKFILCYTLKTNLDRGVVLEMNPLSTDSEIEIAYKKLLPNDHNESWQVFRLLSEILQASSGLSELV